MSKSAASQWLCVGLSEGRTVTWLVVELGLGISDCFWLADYSRVCGRIALYLVVRLGLDICRLT